MRGTRVKALRRLFRTLSGTYPVLVYGMQRFKVPQPPERMSDGTIRVRVLFQEKRGVVINQARRFKRAVSRGESPQSWVNETLPLLAA